MIRLIAEKCLSQPTKFFASKIWLQISSFGDFGIRIRKIAFCDDNSVGEWLTEKNPKTRKKPEETRNVQDVNPTRPEPDPNPKKPDPTRKNPTRLRPLIQSAKLQGV